MKKNKVRNLDGEKQKNGRRRNSLEDRQDACIHQDNLWSNQCQKCGKVIY